MIAVTTPIFDDACALAIGIPFSIMGLYGMITTNIFVVYRNFVVLENMKFGSYYQAHVVPEHAWFFTGVLRSFEHVAFDRTLDKAQSLFEFFVPQDTEKHFLDLMNYFQKEEIISGLIKKENRLKDPKEVI